ncbi:MAG: peptide-methionine (S)-S-oxide reductase MsrA [Bradymonadaceae bacterium]
MRQRTMWLLAALLVVGCTSTNGEKEQEVVVKDEQSESSGGEQASSAGQRADPDEPVQPDVGEGLAAATFAGGCFWCMEPPFEDLEGVKSVVSGYCGGKEKDPSYDQVAGGETGHAETVRITYDPDKISYEKLLKVFWRSHDPTTDDRQFADVGSQYRPVIFYHTERQKKLAEESKQRLADEGPFDEPIVTAIEPASTFWKAEAYHQDYYKKNPDRYKSYYRGSGRKKFLEQIWGEQSK